MPLAAHAVWDGGTLRLSAALGDSVDLHRPMLRAEVEAVPLDEAAARALGEQAAARLRAAGAAAYLPATP
jgi:hydroxymethylbilane synthase